MCHICDSQVLLIEFVFMVFFVHYGPVESSSEYFHCYSKLVSEDMFERRSIMLRADFRCLIKKFEICFE
jgi:hypothetical protein